MEKRTKGWKEQSRQTQKYVQRPGGKGVFPSKTKTKFTWPVQLFER